MVETIFPPKKKARDPSAWCWESPAKGEGQIETSKYMVAPFLGQQKAGSLEHYASRNPAEISIDNFLKTQDFCGALFEKWAI